MIDLLIDGNSIFTRAWYATKRDKDDFDPDAALRSCLLTMISLLNPEIDRIGTIINRMLVLWDGEHGRDKGDRQTKPQEFYDTRVEFQKALTNCFGGTQFTPKAHEADDALGTAVYQLYEKSEAIYVVSGDKDLYQLHGGNVFVYSLVDQGLISDGYIFNKFGVKKPSQVAIALAIMGDSVDNIKGIRGWGAKKVRKLFEGVNPEWNFEKTYGYICGQIPAHHMADFLDSFERTLLDTEVPDVPEPGEIKLAKAEVFAELRLPGLLQAYDRIASYYGGDERSKRGRTYADDEDDDAC